jgi:hypothetical protein
VTAGRAKPAVWSGSRRGVSSTAGVGRRRRRWRAAIGPASACRVPKDFDASYGAQLRPCLSDCALGSTSEVWLLPADQNPTAEVFTPTWHDGLDAENRCSIVFVNSGDSTGLVLPVLAASAIL